MSELERSTLQKPLEMQQKYVNISWNEPKNRLHILWFVRFLENEEYSYKLAAQPFPYVEVGKWERRKWKD